MGQTTAHEDSQGCARRWPPAWHGARGAAPLSTGQRQNMTKTYLRYKQKHISDRAQRPSAQDGAQRRFPAQGAARQHNTRCRTCPMRCTRSSHCSMSPGVHVSSAADKDKDPDKDKDKDKEGPGMGWGEETPSPTHRCQLLHSPRDACEEHGTQQHRYSTLTDWLGRGQGRCEETPSQKHISAGL
jgi:hypothetical protein